MRSWLASLRTLTLPFGAKVPSEPALVLGPDLPTEIKSQFPQFKAAIIGYVGSYDPALTSPQVKYHFIGLYSDLAYNAVVMGYVLDLNATSSSPTTKRVVTSVAEGTDNTDLAKPYRSAVTIGPNATVGTADDYIQLLGAVYVNQTLQIKNAGDDLNGWRNWKACSFAAGWSNFPGYNGFAVKRHVDGTVFIRGVLQTGTIANNTKIGQLPTDDKGNGAWNPISDQALTVRSANTTGITGLYVDTFGQVFLQTVGSSLGAPASWIWINHSWSVL